MRGLSIGCALALAATTAACSQVKARHGDIDITVTEFKKVKEFKVPGAGPMSPYAGSYVAKAGEDLAVVTFEATKEIKVGAVLVDANRREYPKVFSQTAHYDKGAVKVVAVFLVPEQASLRSLKLGETSIGISRLLRSAE